MATTTIIFIKAMTFFILAYPFPHTFSFIILQNAPYFYRTFAKNVCSLDSFSRSQSEHQDSNLRLGLTAHAPSRSGRCSGSAECATFALRYHFRLLWCQQSPGWYLPESTARLWHLAIACQKLFTTLKGLSHRLRWAFGFIVIVQWYIRYKRYFLLNPTLF